MKKKEQFMSVFDDKMVLVYLLVFKFCLIT